MSDASKRKAKQKWVIEKPKLMPEDCVVFIYFIDPDDGEFKDTMKNARRKLEVPMPAATPCKLQREKYRETCRVEKDCKTKYDCIVEADESTRKLMEGSLHKNHEDHIAGKGMNPLSHYNLVRNFIPMPQSLEVTRCKSCSGEGMGKIRENTGIAADESQKEEGIAEARNEGRKVQFESLMDLCHLKNSELEPQYQKYKGRAPR